MVDLDLEKFFDRVNHDKLMSQVAKRVKDRRLLRLIRSWLTAGVLESGLVELTEEGTPQGGLSLLYYRILFSTNLTGSWSDEGIVLYDMRTTATSMSAVNERANA